MPRHDSTSCVADEGFGVVGVEAPAVDVVRPAPREVLLDGEWRLALALEKVGLVDAGEMVVEVEHYLLPAKKLGH